MNWTAKDINVLLSFLNTKKGGTHCIHIYGDGSGEIRRTLPDVAGNPGNSKTVLSWSSTERMNDILGRIHKDMEETRKTKDRELLKEARNFIGSVPLIPNCSALHEAKRLCHKIDKILEKDDSPSERVYSNWVVSTGDKKDYVCGVDEAAGKSFTVESVIMSKERFEEYHSALDNLRYTIELHLHPSVALGKEVWEGILKDIKKVLSGDSSYSSSKHDMEEFKRQLGL